MTKSRTRFEIPLRPHSSDAGAPEHGTAGRALSTPAAIGLALLLVALGLMHRPTLSVHTALAGLAAYWTALAWAGARVARWLLGTLSGAERLITAFTVTIGLLVISVVGLGHFGMLSARNAMLVTAVMLLASCALPVPWRGRQRQPHTHEKAWHAGAARSAAIATAVILTLSLGEAIQDARYLPPGAINYDDNYYHLPAAVEWFQHGDLRMLKIGHGDPSPAFYPIATELVAWSHLAMLAGDDFTARFVDLPFALGCLLAIVATARALGLGTYAAMAAMLLFATLPGFPVHMLSAGNDLAMAFFTLAAVHAIAIFARCPGVSRAAYAGCAIGLLFGTKYTALVFGPPLVLLACLVMAHPRVRRAAPGRRRGLPAAVGLLVLLSVAAGTATLTGGYTYLRNAVTAGNPIYPAQLTVAGRVVLPGWRSQSPKVLYQRRQAATAPAEFLWDRNDLFGPLFRWTLLPAALIAPAMALLALPMNGRRGRRTKGTHTVSATRQRRLRGERLVLAAALSLPAVFYAGFYYLIADQRDARYLFPALALAAVAFAWLVERMPRPWRSVVVLAVAVAAAPVVVLQFGHESPLWTPIAVPLVAAVIHLLIRLRRHSEGSSTSSEPPPQEGFVGRLRERLKRFLGEQRRVGVRVLLTACLLLAVWPGLARTAEKYRTRRLDPNGAPAFMEHLTHPEPAVIAYAGGNQPYLFFGRHLRNEILYVPTYEVDGALYYTWGGSLAMPRGPRNQQAWYRNLAELEVRYLVALAVTDTPPELTWIEQLSCCHELLWHHGAVRIYSLRPHALAKHLARYRGREPLRPSLFGAHGARAAKSAQTELHPPPLRTDADCSRHSSTVPTSRKLGLRRRVRLSRQYSPELPHPTPRHPQFRQVDTMQVPCPRLAGMRVDSEMLIVL